jgi:hypothetical protein
MHASQRHNVTHCDVTCLLKPNLALKHNFLLPKASKLVQMEAK